MTNMKLLIGIVCMMQLYKVRCSIFENIRVKTADDGNVLAILVDPSATNSTRLEIKFNLQEVDLTPPNQRNKPENSKKKNRTLRVIKVCSANTDLHCRETETDIRLLVQKIDQNCQAFNYSSATGALVADINLTGIHLYGGSVHRDVQWPADKQKDIRDPFVTSNEHLILEPYWLVSNGYYIHVDEAVPLFISLDPQTRSFQLIAENTAPYVKPNRHTILSFKICKFENVRVAHEHAVKHVLGMPSSIPNLNRVKNPTWSTWIRYEEDINEQKVLNYAEEIVQHGYTGQLAIAYGWERCYGSLEPDKSKFPDLRRLVERLKKLHFVGVSLWVHPFVNVDCDPVYTTSIQQGYFVKKFSNQTLMINNKSNVDFTNPQATDWYRERLQKLTSFYGINSFMFVHGQCPNSSELLKFYKMDDQHPETIAKEYMKIITGVGTNNVQTAMARGIQRYPVFVTMCNSESKWKEPSGLSTVITKLLQLNVLGYSFVAPGVIRDYSYDSETRKELSIRFLQTNLFMPSMKSMKPPWDFGPMHNNLTKNLLDLRSKYIDKIICLMHNTVVNGAPVNPPIWWIAPDDPEALVCDTEFLLGEDLLVAPVLKIGETSRDIYLPRGSWRDENNLEKDLIQGPTWLRNYPASLSVLPHFTRIGEKVLCST